MTAFIPSPSSNGVHLGPLFVHAYGVAYVVAVLAAVAITSRRWERVGGDRALVQRSRCGAFPAGLIGGRLYFLATSWNEVPAPLVGAARGLEGRAGHLGRDRRRHAGRASGVLRRARRGRRRCSWTPPRRRCSSRRPSAASATTSTRSCSAVRRRCRGGWRSTPRTGPPATRSTPTFHPTFLYELLWNLLAGRGASSGSAAAARSAPPGLFALYVAGYSRVRIFEELLRVDPAHHILGLRLNFFVAALLFVAGLAWFAAIQTGRKISWRSPRRGAGLFAVGAALCVCGCGGAQLPRVRRLCRRKDRLERHADDLEPAGEPVEREAAEFVLGGAERVEVASAPSRAA